MGPRSSLVDLTDAVGFFSDLFDPDSLARVRVRTAETGQKTLYGLPIGRSTNYLHVWKSFLDKAGFTLGDIPEDRDEFWSFWCDQVQSAVRRATSRDDIWLSSRPMEYNYANVSGDWRYGRIWEERVWAKAIHRVPAEGISPEQAVDEAIARINQILAE